MLTENELEATKRIFKLLSDKFSPDGVTVLHTIETNVITLIEEETTFFVTVTENKP